MPFVPCDAGPDGPAAKRARHDLGVHARQGARWHVARRWRPLCAAAGGGRAAEPADGRGRERCSGGGRPQRGAARRAWPCAQHLDAARLGRADALGVRAACHCLL
eukprot:248427-Chlamydomonas_euryale.AAC.1